MKLIKRLVVVLVVLLVLVAAGVGFAVYKVNDIAKVAIEKGGTYAMGVPTTVGGVNISLTGGTFALSDLRIANPAGFAAPHFFTLGKGGVAVSLASLNQPIVTLPEFTLDGIDARIERKGDTANYRAILDNLARLGGGGGGSSGTPAPDPAGGAEKKFIISTLTIRNVKVHADLLGAQGAVGDALNAATKVTIPIDEIRLTNVGRTGAGVGGSGVTMSQLASIIVQAVLGAAAEKGGGVLPADLLGDLQGQLAKVGDIKNLGMTVAGEAKATVERVGKQVEGEAKKAVEEGRKAVEEGLKGLLPGGKKEEKK
jgi:uncharacterized protein involved in outer membrane biogenesis